MADQLISQLVCQYCGRTIRSNAAEAEHWLNEPHRSDYSIKVVRCPQHWSEWALRNTEAGRTKVMRARMQEALAQPEPTFPAWVEPFPIKNKWES